MVTWVGVVFHRGVIQRSWWGHLKGTIRSNLLKTVENSLFLLFLLALCSLEMSYMMSWNIPRSQHGPTQKHPREVAEITFRVGGFVTPPPPSNHPCVNTVSYRTMYKIAHWCYILTNDQYIYKAKPKYTWWNRLGLYFTGFLPQGHGKVISRLQQGQISLKWVKIDYWTNTSNK